MTHFLPQVLVRLSALFFCFALRFPMKIEGCPAEPVNSSLCCFCGVIGQPLLHFLVIYMFYQSVVLLLKKIPCWWSIFIKCTLTKTNKTKPSLFLLLRKKHIEAGKMTQSLRAFVTLQRASMWVLVSTRQLRCPGFLGHRALMWHTYIPGKVLIHIKYNK